MFYCTLDHIPRVCRQAPPDEGTVRNLEVIARRRLRYRKCPGRVRIVERPAGQAAQHFHEPAKPQFVEARKQSLDVAVQIRLQILFGPLLSKLIAGIQFSGSVLTNVVFPDCRTPMTATQEKVSKDECSKVSLARRITMHFQTNGFFLHGTIARRDVLVRLGDFPDRLLKTTVRLRLQSRLAPQLVRLIGLFPGKLGFIAAKVAIAGGLLVDRPAKVE